jgi:hypothetical protein
MVTKEAKMPLLKLLAAEGAQEKMKTGVHLLLCLTIALLTVTGAFYYFKDALGFEKEAVHWVKELHEWLLWPLLLFVGLHIAGVIRHELVSKEAVVSRMIHGDEVKSSMIEYFFVCPWCWQRISVLIDGGLTRFQGIEDCEVCCNPIVFDIRIEEGEVAAFRAEKAQ